MKLDGVIFDMDGLMLDTERLGCEAWSRAASEMGLEMPAGFYLKLIGSSQKDCRSILTKLTWAGFPLEDYISAANALYRASLEAPPPCKRGLFELLDFLEERNLPKAVATSTHGELAKKKLVACDIYHRFSAVVTGDMVQNGKPAPDIYHLAAAKFGTEAARCIVLEDSPIGVMGASAAGAHVLMIPDLIEPEPLIRERAAAVVNSLEEVPAYLLRQGLA